MFHAYLTDWCSLHMACECISVSDTTFLRHVVIVTVSIFVAKKGKVIVSKIRIALLLFFNCLNCSLSLFLLLL